MSMLLAISFLFCNGINVIQCAPKLGHILFDPLSHEAKLTNFSKKPPKFQEDGLKDNLRMPIKIEETSKKPCSGYDYNETLCKTVDDRVICGYNKNIGNISDNIVNLGNGCKIRGDRLECGYFEGPYNVLRRPPAKDKTNDSGTNILNLRFGSTKTTNILTRFNVTFKPSNYNFNLTTRKETQGFKKLASESTTKTSILIIKTPATISSIQQTSLVYKSSLRTALHTNETSISRRANVTKSKRYCVDKSDRIFCYSIKQ